MILKSMENLADQLHSWLQAASTQSGVRGLYFAHGTLRHGGECNGGCEMTVLIPPILKIVAVELKVDDAADVLRQSRRNREIVGESYAAMPIERIDRMRKSTISAFSEAGVGLLACCNGEVEIHRCCFRK